MILGPGAGGAGERGEELRVRWRTIGTRGFPEAERGEGLKKGVANPEVRDHREAPKKPPDLDIRGCQCCGQEHFPSTVGRNFGGAPQ